MHPPLSDQTCDSAGASSRRLLGQLPTPPQQVVKYWKWENDVSAHVEEKASGVSAVSTMSQLHVLPVVRACMSRRVAAPPGGAARDEHIDIQISTTS